MVRSPDVTSSQQTFHGTHTKISATTGRLPSRSLNWALAIPAMLLFLVASTQASTFTVVNTSDSGAGSLRQAISDANGNPGADTIAFNIPGSGVHTISPLTPLPTVTGPVTIDGYTQPGSTQNTLAVGDNAVLLIEISGALVSGTFTDGLDMFGGGSTIRGLVINHFPEFGINFVFGDPGGNVITGNFIGCDPSGTIALGNGTGASFSIGRPTTRLVGPHALRAT